jgi:hypothetical protein
MKGLAENDVGETIDIPNNQVANTSFVRNSSKEFCYLHYLFISLPMACCASDCALLFHRTICCVLH